MPYAGALDHYHAMPLEHDLGAQDDAQDYALDMHMLNTDESGMDHDDVCDLFLLQGSCGAESGRATRSSACLSLPSAHPFYERNAQLDARQREIDEARAQIQEYGHAPRPARGRPSARAQTSCARTAVLAQDARTAKGAMQSLHMESDAAPSGAMLQDARPPAARRYGALNQQTAAMRELEEGMGKMQLDNSDDKGCDEAAAGKHVVRAPAAFRTWGAIVFLCVSVLCVCVCVCVRVCVCARARATGSVECERVVVGVGVYLGMGLLSLSRSSLRWWLVIVVGTGLL